jgi:hypothetical protein
MSGGDRDDVLPERVTARLSEWVVRFWIYAHIIAVVLTGLGGLGASLGLPHRWLVQLYPLSLASIYLILVFPFGYLMLLGLVTLPKRDLYFTIGTGSLGTVAHIIAALPAIQ